MDRMDKMYNVNVAEAMEADFRLAPEIKRERPAFTKPSWWENETIGGKKQGLYGIVRSYLNGTLKKAVLYRGNNGTHVFSTRKKGTELWLFKKNPSVKVKICIAKKVGDVFVGNSSSLLALKQASGKIYWSGGQRFKVQELLGDCMPMVPFRMFKEARLSLDSMRVIDKNPDEMIDVGREGLAHFMGAMVFSIGDRFYLFDIDRNDLAMKQFNPFLSRLSGPVRTVREAYESLKPEEVRQAERFLKRECPRQGEWFFIPCANQRQYRARATTNWDGSPRRGRHPFKSATLQSKGNRAHYASMLSEDGNVRGKISHGGREHKDIFLDRWHKAVPNSAVESFQISGDVD